MKPTRQELYDPGVLMWHDLCAGCWDLFRRWRDAPNPGAWNNPKVQDNPQLLAFLAGCRVTGPSPEQWAETVSWQLLYIRRECTKSHEGRPRPVSYGA